MFRPTLISAHFIAKLTLDALTRQLNVTGDTEVLPKAMSSRLNRKTAKGVGRRCSHTVFVSSFRQPTGDDILVGAMYKAGYLRLNIIKRHV